MGMEELSTESLRKFVRAWVREIPSHTHGRLEDCLICNGKPRINSFGVSYVRATIQDNPEVASLLEGFLNEELALAL